MTPDIILSDSDWPYTKAKTAVLSAAAAVIREEGPRAATLKNIASRAGITEPAIFRHFDGVDGLFAGLFTVFERIFGRIDEAYRSEGKGIARLRAAVRAIVDHLASSHDFAYILIHARQVFREYPELRERIAELGAKDFKNALSCIEEGVKSGEIRSDVDPASIAVSLMGGINTIVALWIESGYAFDLRQVCGDRWEDVERLVAAKPSARPRESKDSAAAKARFAAIFSMKPSRAARAAKAAKSPKGAKAAKGAKAGAGKSGSAAKKPRSSAAKPSAAKKGASRKPAASSASRKRK